jgi:hypothetical protein
MHLTRMSITLLLRSPTEPLKKNSLDFWPLIYIYPFIDIIAAQHHIGGALEYRPQNSTNLGPWGGNRND